MPPESENLLSTVRPWLEMALPWLLILLGLSFLYKAILAIFWGRTRYWKGFLPITLVSPFFIHFPASERSPIKKTHQWWVHVLLGPIFLFLGLGLCATGADLMGLPGTGTINRVLTLGQDYVQDSKGEKKRVEPPIVFNREKGYSFPMIGRIGKFISGILSIKIPERDKENQSQ